MMRLITYKKNKTILLLYILLMVIISGQTMTFADIAADENYDDNSTGNVGEYKATQIVLDGIKYDIVSNTHFVSVISGNGSPLSDDGADHYLSMLLGSGSSVTISMESNDVFALDSFYIDVVADDNVTITSSSGGSYNIVSDSLWVNQLVNGLTNFDNITSFTIAGEYMSLNIDDLNFEAIPTYTVTYDGNTASSGSVPTDSNNYTNGQIVTVASSGTLVKTGYSFDGWNTAFDGSGTDYAPDDTFSMSSSNVTLYAQWTQDQYSVSYDRNGASSGSVPTDGSTYTYGINATVLGNTGNLTKTGYTFGGWNTLANGSGTNYNPGDSLSVSSNTTLYADWTPIDYTVTYDGNGNDGGSVPIDVNNYHIGDTVTVKNNSGGLSLSGYDFVGWNTLANGSGAAYAGASTLAMGSNNVVLYAQWALKTYNVTYDGNTATSGSVPLDAMDYHDGDTVTVKTENTLLKTGYTFNVWNTMANGSGSSYSPSQTFIMGASDITLYAQWTQDQYTLTYNGNNASSGSVPVDGSTYIYGANATVLFNSGSLSRTGYIFGGWNTQSDGSGSHYDGNDTLSMLTDTTLYAEWTPIDYSITYMGNGNTGGSVPVDATAYNIGDIVNVLANSGSLVKSGYDFVGWNTASDGSGTDYAENVSLTMGASNVTLYAQWVLKTYHVIYDGNTESSGSVPTDSTNYNIGDTVTVLSKGTLVKLGYSFDGWNTASDGSGTDYSASNTFVIGASDVTLFAQWTQEQYGLTYDGNSSSSGSVPTDASVYVYGTSATVLGNTGSLARNGYTFSGWNTLANGLGFHYDAGELFLMNQNATLYAEWTPIDYSITYNGNTNTGGSAPIDSNTYHIGNSATVLDSGTLTKIGYSFEGWNTAVDGSGADYVAGNSVSFNTSNIVLYAQWTQDQYTVTYDSNSATSGSVPIDATQYLYGDVSAILSNSRSLMRTGYTFSGWNTVQDGSGIHYSSGSSLTVNSNITLFAEWTPIDYSVIYDGNGNTAGLVPNDASVYHIGDTVTTLSNSGNLVKTGYDFSGWNTSADGSGFDYAASDTFLMGSSNVTLYAQWRLKTYTVIYNSNSATSGSVPVDSAQYHVGDTVTVMSFGTLAKQGYTFSGWNTASNGSGTFYNFGDTFIITANNLILYAQWQQDQYTVLYDANGATSGQTPVDTNTYFYGDSATLIGNTALLEKTGYTFDGWNIQADGSGTHYEANDLLVVQSNTTIYAEWQAIDYHVTYDGNGNTSGLVPEDNSIYHYQDTAAVLKNTGNLLKTGYTFKGWNTQADGNGQHYIGDDSLVVSHDVILYAEWQIVNNTKPKKDPVPDPEPIDIVVSEEETLTPDSNGDIWANIFVDDESKSDKAKVLVQNINGKTNVEVKIDENAVVNDFKNASNSVLIPVKGDVDNINIVFSSKMIDDLAKEAVMIKTQLNDVTYNLPSNEIDIASIKSQFGMNDENDKGFDLKVEIDTSEILEKPEYDQKTNDKKIVTLVQPLTFRVYASHVDKDGIIEDLEINQFNHYIERTIKLPEGIDPFDVTTGVVFDGDIVHVPTTVVENYGEWFVTINALTNSTYSVIENHVQLESVNGHWSKVVVNDLASRMVIDTSTAFLPNEDITRGDFINYLVRGLGLYKVKENVPLFSDAFSGLETESNALIARSYGIVSGYEDNYFRPEQNITREEAMVMLSNALDIIDIELKSVNDLSWFDDLNEVDSWAESSVYRVVETNIIRGTTSNMISPRKNITNAESAQAIHNLLVQTGLIND